MEPENHGAPRDQGTRTERIRRRAYELFLARQGQGESVTDGALHDWLAAEAELRNGLEHEIQAPGPDELETATDVKGERSCLKSTCSTPQAAGTPPRQRPSS